jgi:hypothetical protein
MTRKRTSENDLGVSGGTGAAPSRHKPAGRNRAKHTTTAGETAVPVVHTEQEPVSAAPDSILLPEAPLSIATVVVAVPVEEPTRAQIAELAYLYWEARGCHGGSPEEDWLRAEQELRQRAFAV